MFFSLPKLILGFSFQFPGPLLWADLLKERKALSQLDDHLLRDIGVTPEAARRESRRLFWDAPDHWHR